MKTKQAMKRTTFLVVALLLVSVTSAAYAQTGGGYDLGWSTIDGGGYTFSTGGGYSLGGTAGQPEAGVMSGGGFTLAGGFWVSVAEHRIYLPLVLRNYIE